MRIFDKLFPSTTRVSNEVIMNPEQVTLEYTVTEDLCMVVRKPNMLIETQLRGISKQALHCSLKDIVPKCAVSRICIDWLNLLLEKQDVLFY